MKIGKLAEMHSSSDSQRTIAGTLSYVAPEMVLGQPYGRAIDIWASLTSLERHSAVDVS
jgi:serine/threonine protein kinase